MKVDVKSVDGKVVGSTDLPEGVPATCHGMYGALLSDLFSQLNAFLAQDGCGGEIILLDMNHLYTGNDGTGISWPAGVSPPPISASAR